MKLGHLQRDLRKCQVVKLLVPALLGPNPQVPLPPVLSDGLFHHQYAVFVPGPDLELRSLRLQGWDGPFCTWLRFLLRPLWYIRPALQNPMWEPQEGADPYVEEISGQDSTLGCIKELHSGL